MYCSVIFGGAGFIGIYFAKYLIDNKKTNKVYVADIEPLEDKKSLFRQELFLQYPQIEYVQCDVRKEICWQPLEQVGLVANFAAVHREPGHEDYEYYETNILGAKNVCRWAEKVGCSNIIFTSSISPYGPTESEKTEKSLPVPTTAYGGSKLVAEYIHQVWQAKDHENRRLVIVRPGVVFGPGEGGNVSRLIKAVLHRYFFYMGNANTRKAGTYVKELCHAMWWVFDNQGKHGETVSIFNMSMNPGPSIRDYVDAVCKVSGLKRFIFTMPYPLLLVTSYIIDVIARPLGISHPFSPVRIRKLVRSNNILPDYLVSNGYEYQYELETAFMDWKESCPAEWQ